MNKISVAFKKLLGNGRAWLCIDQFTSDFFDVLMAPVIEVAKKISNLKYTHFPSLNLDECNIKNDEELFNITDIQNKSLAQRAEYVESQWKAFAGSHTYQQIENILRGMGFDVTVIENIPNNLTDNTGERSDVDTSPAPAVYGNSILTTNQGNYDPVQYKNGKSTFIIETDNLEDSMILKLVNTAVKIKPAHRVFILLYKFLAQESRANVAVTIQESIKTDYDCTKPL